MRLIAPIIAIAAVLAGSGCAATNVAPKPVDQVSQARDLVPSELRERGELIVGTDPTFQPMTYLENGQYLGMDIDLGNAIAGRLGLRLKWTTVPFGGLIDQTVDHKIDLIMTSMFDKAARQNRIDFLDYMYVGTSIVVPKGTGDIGGMAGLCGRRVAVQADTVYADAANRQSERCPADKKPTVVPVPQDPIPEVSAGRADAAINDYPIGSFRVAQDQNLEISGSQIEAMPYGIGFAKDRKGLTKAFQQAFYVLVEDGTYDRLLAKWKLAEGALRTGAINGGV